MSRAIKKPKKPPTLEELRDLLRGMTDEELGDAKVALHGIPDPFWHLFGWGFACAIDDEHERREDEA